jgi:ABC-type bacteriocin/lantibiotic exporter with double-glycine peptidase domain
MLVGLIYAVITVGYVYQHAVPGQAFMIGGLVVLLGYVNQFTSVFNDIASQYTQIVKFDTDIQNVKDIEKAAQENPPKQERTPLPSLWKEINISNLNFIRPGQEDNARPTGVHDLALRIRRGERVALIGESGSGKSTLLTLLRGLHDAKPGADVQVESYGKIALNDIASAVTLFPQEPEIFEDTVRYNITLGLPFSEAEVMQACKDAQFTDVLNKLPDGLNTFLHEKGANLSGGQKQRLAIARGILAAKNSDIILMDEPTSSVDPKTERMLYNNLFDTFKEKAVISSLHRLHLLTQFDYVYIMRNGVVIDEGSFEDLKRYSLVMQEMWQHQTTRENAEATMEEFGKLNVAL